MGRRIRLVVRQGALGLAMALVASVAIATVRPAPALAANSAPTISDVADRATAQDTPTPPIPFTIGDAETADDDLTLTTGSSNTTLVPPANIVLGGSGANRTVTVTPAMASAGTATITLTVSDGELTASDTFDLTVNSTGNSQPTISDIADVTTPRDTPTAPIPFTIGDAETPPDDLTLLGISSNTTLVPNANIVFGGSGANRTVTVTPAPGQSGTATILVQVGDDNFGVADTFVVTVPGPPYNPLTPARILDTRPGFLENDGYEDIQPLNGDICLPVLDRGGVPASGVGAVVLNVTVTAPTGGGYLTVYPGGTPLPYVSNLNFTQGQTVPNLVIAKIGNCTGPGGPGQVRIYNAGAGTHVIADVNGWFPTGASYNALTPERILDTRPFELETDGYDDIQPLDGDICLPVLGRGGVPASGVGAVVLNVTVTAPAGWGYLTVYPGGTTRPYVSNLNFTEGLTVPNLVIAKIGNCTGPGGPGQVRIYNAGAGTHVIADVNGWFPTGASYNALTPERLLDTRPGAVPQTDGYNDIQPLNGDICLPVLGRGGVPASGVGAVVLNVTVTAPAGSGYLTVYPGGTPLPYVSNLNFTEGQTVPNLVIAKVGSCTGPGGPGQVRIYNAGASTHIIADVNGWFPS